MIANKNKLLLMIFLFLNSQLFFVTGGNLMGIRYAQEAFFVILILYSLHYWFVSLVNRPVWAVYGRKYDVFVVLSILIVAGFSALFAFIEHGQPIFFGLIESRITLALLIYFPIKKAITKHNFEPEFLLRLVVHISLAIVIFSIAIKAGLVPTSLFATPIVESSVDLYRVDRNSMGRYYFIFSFIICFCFYIKYRNLKYLIYCLIFFSTITFVVKERQNILGLGAVVVSFTTYYVLRGRKMSVVAVVLGSAAVAFGLVIYLFPESIRALYQLFATVFSEDVVETLRYREIQTIFIEMGRDPLFGKGALSRQWNGGFHRIYGTFYLQDVGILGTFYRIGLILTTVLWLYFAFIVIRLIRSAGDPLFKGLLCASIVFILATFPTSAPFEYRGHFLGFVMAIVLGQAYKEYLLVRK